MEDVYEPYLMQIGFLVPDSPGTVCHSAGL